MAKSKYSPNKLSKGVIRHLQKSYSEKKLNIAKEAKKLNVSRISIYRCLHKKNLVRKWGRDKSFLQKIKDFVLDK